MLSPESLSWANGLRGRQEVLRHVAAVAQGGLKFFEREEDFAIVIAGVLFGFDVDGADQAAVLAESEIGSGTNVGVIEAEAGGLGHEGDSAAAVGRNEWSALFGGAVDVGGNELAVPVQLLGNVGVVANIDGDLLAFFQAKQRAGKLAVVGGDGDDALGRDFQGLGGDGESVVGRDVRHRSRLDRGTGLSEEARR